MFRFEDISALYLLAIIPVMVLIYLIYRRWIKRDFYKLSHKSLFYRLVPEFSWWKRNIKFSLLMAALTVMCIAWANPQWGNKKEKMTVESSDIFIALDISQSMMAADISPNRLERAKRMAQELIRSLKGNRIGLIFFAGNAYLQMPLTSDYAAAEIFVQSANTNQAGTQGTAISEAIDLALRAFEKEREYQKAMIIITDGENHENEALQMAREARNQGLLIYTIGIGTEEGGFIPYVDRGQEQFKRDENGNPIKSKLNLELIKQLAQAGDGDYFVVQEGRQLISELKNDIDKMAKQEVEQRAFTEYASYFQYFLGIGIILLLIEFFISNKGKTSRTRNLFEI